MYSERIVNNATSAHKIRGEHSVRRRGRFIAPVSWHYQIHISISPNTHLNIIKYIYPFHHTRVFFPHFVGVFIYAGTINRPLRLLVVCHYAANGLPKRCEHQRNTHETPTKWGANTPKTPTKHSVRRRGRFIVPVSWHYQIHIFISPQTCIRPPFCGCFHICGHDKSVPYSCLWFAITLRTDCQNIANELW